VNLRSAIRPPNTPAYRSAGAALRPLRATRRAIRPSPFAKRNEPEERCSVNGWISRQHTAIAALLAMIGGNPHPTGTPVGCLSTQPMHDALEG